jgi:hypothetical protein
MTLCGKEHDPSGRRGGVVDLGHGLAIHSRAARGDPGAGAFRVEAGSDEPIEHGGRPAVVVLPRVIVSHEARVGTSTDIGGEAGPRSTASE